MIYIQSGQVNWRSSCPDRAKALAALVIFWATAVAAQDGGQPWFVEIPAERSGIDFRFESGSRGRFDLPEIMGGGFAVADFDSDGLPDLFFCQGGPIENSAKENQDRPESAGSPCVWYRNLGDMRFRRMEVEQAGPSWAMGAWPADFDGDGLVDLFVTGWRGWALLRNLGDWKFEDLTGALGRDTPAWSTAAVWRDFDGDDRLDLFVGGYLEYDPAKAPYCAAPDGRRDYCGPEDFPAVANRLFSGDGKGAFTDVSGRLGPTRKTGRTLGAIAADFDADGDDDLFVANDGTACELLIRDSDGTFRDAASQSGVAFDAGGNALAAMGVAISRKKGQTDLFVTNFFGRGTVQFRRGAGQVFRDVSAETGLRQATLRSNGFGIAVTDFDGDGIEEIVQANGHVLSRERLGTPFAMPPVLLRQGTDKKYRNAGGEIFPVAERAMHGRGLVVADFDRDRRPDILISRLDGPPVLLRNVSHGVRRTAAHSDDSGAGGSYLSGVVPVKESTRKP
ncbi:CRTAC1 family protein [bacterium]|nr:CRTAC1 family protein [bacterium]